MVIAKDPITQKEVRKLIGATYVYVVDDNGGSLYAPLTKGWLLGCCGYDVVVTTRAKSLSLEKAETIARRFLANRLEDPSFYTHDMTAEPIE